MAYYKRTVKQTGDIRARNYAVYHCDACGEDSEFNLVPNFQFHERPCKHCKAMGVEDHLKALYTDRDRIAKQIAELNMGLLKLNMEIEELESKKSVTRQIEEITAEQPKTGAKV